ncbi:MFS transporter [Variovorax sp. E3]|uniref:MFS transporter n=1 Tax=Variovorax sp. E3 TaxID=1914993 RepID=UPI0022B68E4F|nr:MFS transporter [Variovorax sp. E3]
MTYGTHISPARATPANHLLHPSWRMAAIAFIGMAFGQTSMTFLTFGTFMKPLGEEFGWSRGQAAVALSIISVVLLIFTPFAGRLIDRLGARRVLLPSMAGLGLVLCTMYFLTDSLAHFYLMFAILGIVGVAANNVSYVRVLTAWFTTRRGLAIGIASAGTAAGQSIGIGLAQYLIGDYGWRIAYVGLGLAVLLVGLPIVALFLRDLPKNVGLTPYAKPTHGGAVIDAGFSIERKDALRMPVFWALLAISFLMASALHGIQIHFVPMLLDAGINPGQVAGVIVSLLTFGAVIGRIVTGMLFDRFFAPRVAMFVFMLPLIGLFFVLENVGLWGLYAGALFFGIGLGSESDVLGYFTSRYFGLKSMGELYGLVFGAFMGGTALGPVLYGVMQSHYGNYRVALFCSIGMLAAVCLLCAMLPRFKDQQRV